IHMTIYSFSLFEAGFIALSAMRFLGIRLELLEV
ncbi:unnamed protein product, partial [marine sediment metagenome]